MKRILPYLAASLLVVVSCSQPGSNNGLSSGEDIFAEEEILESGEFISVDSDVLKKAKEDPTSISAEDEAIFRKVIHRFYSHVELADGYYTTNVKSGKQLNISEELFQFYLEDMKYMNDMAKKLRKEGKEVRLDPITASTLSSILNP